ncbi:unnamed protein product, partial [Schistosoma haematobium]
MPMGWRKYFRTVFRIIFGSSSISSGIGRPDHLRSLDRLTASCMYTVSRVSLQMLMSSLSSRSSGERGRVRVKNLARHRSLPRTTLSTALHAQFCSVIHHMSS